MFPKTAAALTIASLAALTAPGLAAPAPLPVKTPSGKVPVSYAKDVADVLAGKCVGCHSDALAENKLNMEEVAGMLKGGKRGPAVVPGKADQSLLFQMAAHRVEPVMPPKGKKAAQALTAEELGLLKAWIDSGAKDDSAESAETAKPVVLGEIPPGVRPVNAVDMTADGTRVAFGRANVVQVHDADSGLEIVALGGHKDLIQSVRFSPDGRKLAAGSYEVVTVWNAPTGGPGTTFAGHADQVKDVVILGDPRTLVSGGLDKSIRLWNDKGQARHVLAAPAPVLCLAASPDGSRLLVGGADNAVRLFDVTSGGVLKERAAFRGHTGPVNGVALIVGKAGVTGAASASADGTVRLWEVPAKSGEPSADPKVLTGAKGPLNALALDPTGPTLAAAGDDGKVRIWSPESGSLLRTIDAHNAPIHALAFDPGGSHELLTGSADGSARRIDVPTGAVRTVYGGHPGAVNSVAFSPAPTRDRVITADAKGGVKVWEKESGRGVIAFAHSASGGGPSRAIHKVLATEAGGFVTASADKTLRSWTYEGTWTEFRTFGPLTSRVLALDFNPDGTLLAAGAGEPSRSGEVRLWELGKGLPVRRLDALHSDTVFGVRFSPDGSRLATAGADKFMKVTRVSDGKELRAFEGHTGHVLALDWKSDGKRVVTGGADSVLKVWDIESGEQVRTLQGAGKQITAVRWLPGKAQVAGASGDQQVRLWNPDGGGVLRSFGGAGDYVFALAASADGSRLAAGGADGVLMIWKADNAQVLRKIEPK